MKSKHTGTVKSILWDKIYVGLSSSYRHGE